MSKRPSHGRVVLPQLSVPDYNVWYSPPCGGFSRSGGRWSSWQFAWGKAHPSGRGAGKPPRVERVIPPVRLAASTVRRFWQSSFPFSERTFTSSPFRVQAVFPFERKTPRPMGLQLAKTRSLKGGVRAVLEAVEKSRIASQVIKLGTMIHVGFNILFHDVRKS